MNNLERVQTFNIDEVNERLPLLKRIIDDMVSTWKEREDLSERLTNFRREVAGSGSHELSDTIARLEQKSEQLTAAMIALENEVNQLGGIVKEPSQGFVDFFSDHNGHLVYLAWRPGDDTIRFWHEIDDDLPRLKPISPLLAAPSSSEANEDLEGNE